MIIIPSDTSATLGDVQPISINENGLSIPGKYGRAISMTGSQCDAQSIMKFRTMDESLHSVYGSDSDSSKEQSVKFDKILIREYSLTVGDNPSCSSGPPVR